MIEGLIQIVQNIVNGLIGNINTDYILMAIAALVGFVSFFRMLIEWGKMVEFERQ